MKMVEEGNGTTGCHAEQNNATLLDASSKGHSECVAKLIEAGVNVNGNGYRSPLAAAAKKGHSGCLQLLIQAGADIDKDIGETVLGEAVKGRSEKCVNILLQAGADVNTVTTAGNTALNEAARYIRRPCTRHIFQLLLKSGSRVNIVDIRSLNALMRLAWSSHDRLEDDEAILLYAAGERIKVPLVQRYVGETIALPDYMKPTLCLKHLCRRVITDHLLDIDEHNHLFERIPRLGSTSFSGEVLTV